jgi:TonB family protein
MRNDILIYLLESGICLLAFTLLYETIFRRSGYFNINRSYLLLAVIASLIITLFDFSPAQIIDSPSTIIYAGRNLPEIIVTENNGINHINTAIMLIPALSMFFLVKLTIRYVNLFKILLGDKNSENIIRTSDFDYSFSFFGRIVIPQNVPESAKDIILYHEQEHIRQFHSLDLIFINLFKAVFWFNPAAYFLKKYIIENHEFFVDKKCLEHFDKKTYSDLLLGMGKRAPVAEPVHSIFSSLTYMRIKMLMRKKTGAYTALRYLIILPVLSLMIFMYSCDGDPSIYGEQGSNFDIENQPEPTGGWKAGWDYINENQEYPAEAKKNNITGKVTVEFVVNEDGSLSDVDIKKSKLLGEKWKHEKAGYGLDEEALRLVRNMPAWQPATKDGKPVKYKKSLILFFGDMKAWNESYPASLIGSSKKDGSQIDFYNSTADSLKKNIDFRPVLTSKMLSDLSKRIEYTKEAKEAGIEGKILVEFTVNSKGDVIEPKIIKGLGYGLDEVALDAVKGIEGFRSQSQKGVDFPVKLTLPIQFRLKDSKQKSEFYDHEFPPDLKGK